MNHPARRPTNPHGIKDGELLPVEGGPADGGVFPAVVLLPSLAGGIPAAGAIIRGGWYRLDDKGRRWVHSPAVGRGKR